MHKELEECREYQANVKKYLQYVPVRTSVRKPTNNDPPFTESWT